MENKYQTAFNEIKEHLLRRDHWWSTTDRDKYLKTLEKLVDKEKPMTPLSEEYVAGVADIYGNYFRVRYLCPKCYENVYYKQGRCGCGQTLIWEVIKDGE